MYRANTSDDGITRFVASDSRVDRFGDIVRQVWDLASFKANPIVPQNHDYSAPIVGKVVDISVKNGRLMCAIKWDDAADNPDGQRVARQMAQGFMNAVSVGFEPGSAVQRSKLKSDDPWYGRSGIVFGSDAKPNKLLEVSAVSIPANEGALAQRINRHVLSVEEEDGKIVVTYAADETEPEPEEDTEADTDTEDTGPEGGEENIWDDDTDDEDKGAQFWGMENQNNAGDPEIVRAMLSIIRTNDFVRSEIGALAAEWVDDSTTTQPAADWWGE
jgi:hypothetical protein